MTDEQIAALAREYAEAVNPIESYDDDIVERNMDIRIERDTAIQVLRWLCARCCIVERSKVLEEYAATYPDDPDRSIESIRCADLLKDLFPELFKEEEI